MKSTFHMTFLLLNCIFSWFLCFDAAEAQPSSDLVNWKPIGEKIELAEDQLWKVRKVPDRAVRRSFRFTALRFHLGYYRVQLIDVTEFANKERERLAKTQNMDKEFGALLRFGLKAIFDASPFEQRTVAVAPAGFPSESGATFNAGLLKVSNTTRVGLDDDGPSAVLCMDNAPNRDLYQYQVPAFFRTSTPKQRLNSLLEKCRDAVQVGPRILEDSKEVESGRVDFRSLRYSRSKPRCDESENIEVYLGIPESAARHTPYPRVIFAVDEPGRCADVWKREAARNAYIIFTHTPVTLWDIQDMLVSPDFYVDKNIAPHWAVNLVGGDYAGLVYEKKAVGSINATQSSVLFVLRR